MKYCSDDGRKIFDSKEEAETYEALIKARYGERELQSKELRQTWKDFNKVLKLYVNVYGESPIEPREGFLLYKYLRDVKLGIADRLSSDTEEMETTTDNAEGKAEADDEEEAEDRFKENTTQEKKSDNDSKDEREPVGVSVLGRRIAEEITDALDDCFYGFIANVYGI